jgi:hypothetical protein
VGIHHAHAVPLRDFTRFLFSSIWLDIFWGLGSEEVLFYLHIVSILEREKGRDKLVWESGSGRLACIYKGRLQRISIHGRSVADC